MLATGLTGFYLILWGMEQPPRLPTYRLIGLGGVFLCFSAFASLIAEAQLNAPDVWTVAQAGLGGGYLGAVLVATIKNVIGLGGTILFYLGIGAIATLLLTGLTRADILTTWGTWRNRTAQPAVSDAPSRPRLPIARPPPPPPANPSSPRWLSTSLQLRLRPPRHQQKAKPRCWNAAALIAHRQSSIVNPPLRLNL